MMFMFMDNSFLDKSQTFSTSTSSGKIPKTEQNDNELSLCVSHKIVETYRNQHAQCILSDALQRIAKIGS
jgi:hypothetical protein